MCKTTIADQRLDVLRRPRIGLVLAGGAARGAYEVGVVQYVLEDVARDLGRDVPLDILSGTSVGAINVSALAAWAHEPRARARRLADQWTRLRIGEVVNADRRGLAAAFRSLMGAGDAAPANVERRGGLLDPSGIEHIIQRAIPFDFVARNIEDGRVGALTVSTTHVGSGRTVVFMHKSRATPHFLSDDPLAIDVLGPLQAEHASASAAIPFLFPAVRIDGDFYTDGGLRQNVPLSPAVRLGADRLLIVSPKSAPAPAPRSVDAAFPGPFALLGKALNALLLDRLDGDLDRLRGINHMLEAGRRHYGPSFLDRLNLELDRSDARRPLRHVQSMLVRPSQDLGLIAAEYVRSRAFAQREQGLLVSLMRRIADANLDADLLSYLLFDGEYARQLIELGRADARARHQELCDFFADGQERSMDAASALAATAA